MSLYDNRTARTRAFGSGPMTPAERETVKSLLHGFAERVSDSLAAQLTEAGIRIDTLNNGQRYISSVEA